MPGPIVAQTSPELHYARPLMVSLRFLTAQGFWRWIAHTDKARVELARDDEDFFAEKGVDQETYKLRKFGLETKQDEPDA
jgi:hypothetical protein